jgi:uncharacterized glyoxalase superfamily protein PhnB
VDDSGVHENLSRRLLSTVQMRRDGAMMQLRRSAMPQQSGSTIIPSLRYRDAHAAIDWLVRVFGFHKQAVYEGPDGTVMHAQLTHGLGMLMLGSIQNHGEFSRVMVQPDEIDGRETAGLCLIVEDCDAVYASAKTAGAEIVQELSSPDYGGKAFACRDLEGHVWWVGSYNPWAAPREEHA